MVPLLLSLALVQNLPHHSSPVADGILPGTAWNEPAPSAVEIPRIPEARITVDGVMDEGVWRRAVALEGFHQYLPVDDRPASDSTSVRVWYSPTAIYFGIRAYQDTATVRATLADRMPSTSRLSRGTFSVYSVIVFSSMRSPPMTSTVCGSTVAFSRIK